MSQLHISDLDFLVIDASPHVRGLGYSALSVSLSLDSGTGIRIYSPRGVSGGVSGGAGGALAGAIAVGGTTYTSANVSIRV